MTDAAGLRVSVDLADDIVEVAAGATLEVYKTSHAPSGATVTPPTLTAGQHYAVVIKAGESVDIGAGLMTNSGALDKLYVYWHDGTTVRQIGGEGGTATLPLTAKGDLLAHDGTNAVRVPVGTDGQVWIADAAQAPGGRWANLPSTYSYAGDYDPTADTFDAAFVAANPITASGQYYWVTPNNGPADTPFPGVTLNKDDLLVALVNTPDPTNAAHWRVIPAGSNLPDLVAADITNKVTSARKLIPNEIDIWHKTTGVYRGSVANFAAAQVLPMLVAGDKVWVDTGGPAGSRKKGAMRQVIFDTTTTPAHDPAATTKAWSGWYGMILDPTTIDSTDTIDSTATIDATG